MKKLSLSLVLATSCGFLNPEIPEDTCGDKVVDASLTEAPTTLLHTVHTIGSLTWQWLEP